MERRKIKEAALYKARKVRVDHGHHGHNCILLAIPVVHRNSASPERRGEVRYKIGQYEVGKEEMLLNRKGLNFFWKAAVGLRG